jgi:hypothetical protein
MAENKTKPTAKSVPEFLEKIEDPGRKADCIALTRMMERLTNSEPSMWGDSIVGFGTYRYKYPSGREGEWFQAGFSPRKQNLTIYVMGYLEFYNEILANLGKFKHGKGCLYIKRLEDIDMKVLEELIKTSVKRL